LHKKSSAVILEGCALSRLRFALEGRALSRLRFADRRYSLWFPTVGALYQRPRCIFCVKPVKTGLP
jgi:hypothetical protein